MSQNFQVIGKSLSIILDQDSSPKYRPASYEPTVKNSTSTSQPIYNPRSISTIEALPTRMEPTERLQYSSIASKFDSNNRPTIPQPRYRLKEPSDSDSPLPTARLSNYSQHPQSTVSRLISPPFDQIYQPQELYHRRQFLSPTEEFVV